MNEPSPVTPVQFRASSPDDVPRLHAFLQPFVEQKLLLARNDAELTLLSRTGFIAEWEGATAGFAAIEIYSRKLAEVQCLAVSPAVQRRGVGRELVRRCVDLAKERKVLELMAISSSDEFLIDCGFDFSLPNQKRALFIRTCDDESVH